MENIKNEQEKKSINEKKSDSEKIGDFPPSNELPLKEVWERAKDEKSDIFYENLFKKILEKFSN